MSGHRIHPPRGHARDHDHDDRSDLATCHLCEKQVERRILQKNATLESAVVANLAGAHPEWRREKGACFRCVAFALSDLKERERRGDPVPEGAAVPEGIGRRRDILSLQARLHPDLNYTGRGVTVAIIDSDFVFHRDFTKPRNRIVTYVDATGARPHDGAEPPEPYIGSWHGTMVAGAGFGSGASAGGRYAGIAPNARLVFVRIAGPDARVGEAQVLKGMRWVLANHKKYHIRVINLSVGGDVPAPSRKNKLDRLVARAVAAGIVVIAAAGNRPDRLPVAPASAPDAITVGGTNDLGGARDRGAELLFPGAHGPTLDGVTKPDLLAPSVWVPAPMVEGSPQEREAELIYDLESLPDDLLAVEIARRFREVSLRADIILRPPAEIRAELAALRLKQKYITTHHQHVDGTSFAAVIVSAVAAQMIEANPELSPAEVKRILMASCEPIVGVSPELAGAGVLRPALAVRLALEARLGRIPDIESPHIDHGSDVVRYYYYDPSERLTSVEWVGALSGWKPQPMEHVAPTLWMHARPIPAPGRYPYKYILSDGRWTSDPGCERREADGFGDWNSVLVVGHSAHGARHGGHGRSRKDR